MAISKELKKLTSKRRHQESKDTWTELYILFLGSLIDSDSEDRLLEERISKAVELADTALAKIGERWGEE